MTQPQAQAEPQSGQGHDCRNCGASLQGEYCHACGQHAHDPLKSLRHAVEDVFESFWHLDGRVFRTLRDACVPGRVINAYLAGHRARYIPPLRLFVVLSLFTFFIAHLAIKPTAINVGQNDRIAAATDIAAVERIRDEALTEIRLQREQAHAQGESAVGTMGLDIAESVVRSNAETRIAQLREAQSTGKPPETMRDEIKLANGRPWHPVDNPLRIAGAPALVNRWANDTIGRGVANMKRFARDQGALKDAWLSSIPTALFFLVPVFALLLRVFYAFTPWTYLEHLVVALYSHSFILLASAALMLTDLAARGSGHAAALAAADRITDLGAIGIALWLFFAQWRVYRQGLALTTAKFFAIGTIYTVLVSIGAAVALLAVFLK